MPNVRMQQKSKKTRRGYNSFPEVREKQKQTRRKYDSVPEVKKSKCAKKKKRNLRNTYKIAVMQTIDEFDEDNVEV